MTKKSEEVGKFSTANLMKILVFLILVITLIATLRFMLYPLLPEADEYKGSLPENLWENLENYPTIFIRHVILFHEYYDYPYIVSLLSHLFLLFLVISIWKAVNDRDFLKNPRRVVQYYSVWATSSLLIAIVFITKIITPENITTIGLGVLVFALSIIALYILSKRIEN